MPVDAPVLATAARQLAGGDEIEQRIVVAGEAREARQRVDRSGAQRLEQRQQLAPHAVAQERRIRVRRIVANRDAGRVEAGAQRRAPLPEQGTEDIAAPRGNAYGTGEPRPAEQVDEHRLGRVVGRVGGEDQAIVACDLREEAVARVAAGRFDGDALRPRERRDVGPPRCRGEIECGRGTGHECRVSSAVAPQPVVEVRHGETPPDAGPRGRVQHGHRVRATGDREHHGGAGPGAELVRGARERIGQVLEMVGSGGRIRTTDQGLMSPLLYH